MNTVGILQGTAELKFHGEARRMNGGMNVTTNIDIMSTTDIWINHKHMVEDAQTGELAFRLEKGDKVRIKTACGDTQAEVLLVKRDSVILCNISFDGAYNAFGRSDIGRFGVGELQGMIQTSGWEGDLSFQIYRLARQIASVTRGKPHLVRIYEAIKFLESNGADMEDEWTKFVREQTARERAAVKNEDPYAGYKTEHLDEMTED